jgi:6-pyruvoyltetrahydropterin/6-carboxytetrahydropterin synthase
MFYSTKKYGHEEGLSACFRQWRADHSHCSYLHGYALAFEFTFSSTLDIRNWVMDFGGLKGLKAALKDTFDHRLIVAEDDPQKDLLLELSGMGLAHSLVLPHVGCERFAEYAHYLAVKELEKLKQDRRVYVSKVQCWEHGGNSAIYIPDAPETTWIANGNQ